MAPSPDLALGILAAGLRAAEDTARIALAPVRIASRAPVLGPAVRRALRDLEASGRLLRLELRDEAAALAQVVLAAPEVEQAIDRALEGPLLDAIARSVGEHRVVERIAMQIVAATDLEALITQVLESPVVISVTDRVLSSPEMDAIVAHIASSPEVRRALTQQGSSLADEMVTGVRRRTVTLDDAAERTVRGWLRRPKPHPA
jgi:hypothetical protein